MILVILARLRCNVSPFLADRRHLHHRLLDAGLQHRLTVITMYALTWWTSSLALLSAGVPNGLLIFGSATSSLSFMGWKAWEVIQQEQGLSLSNDLKKSRYLSYPKQQLAKFSQFSYYLLK